MIVLDTDVLSEPMKANGDQAVAARLDQQETETLYLTTVNLAELWLGVEMLPLGKRRSSLQARIAEVVNEFDRSHILPFDVQAARLFA